MYQISLSSGSCLGRFLEGSIAFVEPNETIYSGDLVQVLTRYQATGAISSAVKQLEATADGRWWLTCLEGVVPIGGYYVPAAIHRIVSVYPKAYPPPPNPPAPTLNSVTRVEDLEFWDKESRAARFEWTKQGKVRGIPFPGIEAALLAGRPSTDWPVQFRLPPDYLAILGERAQ